MSDSNNIFVETDEALTSHKVPKIRLRGVSKSFGNNHVLQGVDLDVMQGESLVVIGGSGTGKSVLLKCILGLIEPDEGVIEIDGVDTTHVRGKKRAAVMRKFGMLFQDGALFDSLPIWENVAFGLIQGGKAGRKVGRKEAREIAIENMRLVGLGKEVAGLFPAELSGGMQKRVGLARAVATKPEIIFFDEPTTGLDPIMADVINKLIVTSTRSVGATGMSITHDMSSVRAIADNVAMLYDGRIIWHGAASEIDHSGNEYVSQFIEGRANGPIAVNV